MSRRSVQRIALACALSAGCLCAPSSASALSPAVADCNQHAALTRTYSVAELKTALATMPADIREYTDCYDVIQRTLLGRLGQQHGAGSGQGGGSFLPTGVVVVLVLLGLSAVSFAVVALQRRRRSA
jgi:hypothetical protein